MSTEAFTQAQLEWIRNRLKIAVVHGGDRTGAENYIYKNISPRSTKTYQRVAHDIADGLQGAGFKHVMVLEENIDLAHRLKALNVDLVFTNSGGLQGFDSMCHLPALLEMLGMPYIGHSPMQAGLLDNKLIFKNEISAIGIPTAPFITLNPGEQIETPAHQRALDFIESEFGEGFVVKPVVGRASVHVYPVFDRRDLQGVVDRIHLATNNTVLIEPFLSGPEYVVAVAGKTLFRKGQLEVTDKPLAFSVTERLLGEDELIFTSMDIKPITQDRLVKVEEASLREELVSIGCQIYQSFDLQTLVRVDLRKDKRGNLYVLEANPKPDLKRPQGNALSLVCHDLEREHMSYQDLLQSMVFNRLFYLKNNRPQTLAHCLGEEFDALAMVGSPR